MTTSLSRLPAEQITETGWYWLKSPEKGDIVTLHVRNPIWNGIECQLIEQNKDTEQWKMQNVYGTKYTVYFYEKDFSLNK